MTAKKVKFPSRSGRCFALIQILTITNSLSIMCLNRKCSIRQLTRSSTWCFNILFVRRLCLLLATNFLSLKDDIMLLTAMSEIDRNYGRMAVGTSMYSVGFRSNDCSDCLDFTMKLLHTSAYSNVPCIDIEKVLDATLRLIFNAERRGPRQGVELVARILAPGAHYSFHVKIHFSTGDV